MRFMLSPDKSKYSKMRNSNIFYICNVHVQNHAYINSDCLVVGNSHLDLNLDQFLFKYPVLDLI